jgi:putative MATE family efflux protein
MVLVLLPTPAEPISWERTVRSRLRQKEIDCLSDHVLPGQNEASGPQQNIHELRYGQIRSLLTQYSIPAVVATTTASLYNIIDRIFIGHGVGPMAIAGLALTLPLMNMAAAFGSLVGIGGGTLVSIRLGQQRSRDAAQIFGNTLFMNIALGIGYSIVCAALLDPLLRFVGASNATLPYARPFMQIILAGNVFAHLYLGMNGVTRSSGYPQRAMLYTLYTVAVNCALAPLFIFVFHWGIRGAALATVLAQIAGTLISFPHFLRPESTVRFNSRFLRPRLSVIRAICAIGMSNFAMMLCASMTAVLFNVRISRYGGDYAVGAFGITNTLVMLFAMVSMGVNQGMQPIAGFNFGARQFDRVRQVYRDAVICTTFIMILGFLLAELAPRMVAGAFTRDSELIAQTVFGMKIAVLMLPLDGFQMTTAVFFQSIGKAKISMLLALSRQVLFLAPFLVVLPWFWGLTGVWAASPTADAVAFFTTLFVLRFQSKKLFSGSTAA